MENNEKNNGDIHVRLQGSKGEPGDSGSKGDSGVKGDSGIKGDTGEIGATGNTGERGATGETGAKGPPSPLTTKFAYIILAVGVIIGIYFLGVQSSSKLKNDINHVVTTLCLANRPTIIRENKLRDIQIEVNNDLFKLNLYRGDKQRAILNKRQAIALKNAKKHVPTKQECNKKLLE
jgi:hypothetical protein